MENKDENIKKRSIKGKGNKRETSNEKMGKNEEKWGINWQDTVSKSSIENKTKTILKVKENEQRKNINNEEELNKRPTHDAPQNRNSEARQGKRKKKINAKCEDN